MVPVSGDAHKNFHSPLAGIRSGIDNSACGDAIKILHSRERSFCNNFAEMHIKIYIPPSREYDPESTVPLAGMQSKFYIPQAEIVYLFRFMVPASGDAHKKISFPLPGIRSRIDSSACGNAIKILHPRKRRFCNYFCAPSPASGDAHENLHFPLAGILSSTDNSACGNATKILHLRERIFCNYFGSRSRLRKCTISCVSPRAEIRSGRRISASRICKRMCAVPQAVLQEIRSFLIPEIRSQDACIL